ncbi:MAG TPA: pyridoxamine 5'-phosphate oxidase family protein [Actinomycetota bacterium]|nr:pyridoxamine 5'-phosphate oxidase family protein [Actinomycetota bacterium]
MNLLDARRIFRDLPVLNLATTRPDGGPHVVPLWFVWREEAIYVSCRRESATWRNVERDPRVAVSFQRGRNWRELAGAVLLGRAEPLVPEHPALRGVMSQWFEKYRLLLAGGGFRDYAEQVESPGMLRVRPERMAAWDHAVRRSEPDAADA